jgi:GST-like protein
MDAPNDQPYAKDRYRSETSRLYGVFDRQLARHTYVAGDYFSIGDVSIWGWTTLWEGQQQILDDKPHTAR